MKKAKNSHASGRLLKLLAAAIFALLLSSLPTQSAQAQIIRGTVEDSSGVPLNEVVVSLLIANTDSVLRSTRTSNTGEFSLNVARAGKYFIRLNRIGYAQLTSNIIDVRPAEILTVRFSMTVATIRLAPITVVERRTVTMAELMSSAGFDMRSAKYPMNTIDLEKLSGEGTIDFESMLMSYSLRGLMIADDSLGRSFRMTRSDRTRGRVECFPEIYLDGEVLAMGGDLQVPGNAGSASIAFTRLAYLHANQLYGIEAYRGTEIPPPGLGGMFGVNSLRSTTMEMTMRVDTAVITEVVPNSAGTGPCGVVAVWTKMGRERALTLERARADGGATQVIAGRVVDLHSGERLAGATIILQSEHGGNLEAPVRVDSMGNFRIETKQYSKLRFEVKSTTHKPIITPAVNVEPEELLSVEIMLAVDRAPLAPLRLLSREFPRNYPRTQPNGFNFRQRRGLGGVFFDSTQIARSGAVNVAQLIAGVENISVNMNTPAVTFRKPVALPARGSNRRTPPVMEPCTPMYLINGDLERDEQKVLNMQPSQIRALEVYPNASEVPVVFRMGSTGCGVIALWIPR